MLIPQWAGVYPLEKAWVTDRAAEGWLVLNILAHDLPIDEPAKFYEEQSAGPLKDYWAIGNDDRETSYFLRMYLSCYQAAEYLTQRPDWNGKTLVVTGGEPGRAANAGHRGDSSAGDGGAGDGAGRLRHARPRGRPRARLAAVVRPHARQGRGEGPRGEPLLRRGELRPADQVPGAGGLRADRRSLPAGGRDGGGQPDRLRRRKSSFCRSRSTRKSTARSSAYYKRLNDAWLPALLQGNDGSAEK